jgi:YYY domain-containing protein
MTQVFLAFRWYLVVQVFGLAALPLCLRLFRYMPDRGYGLSKPLGLLLAGWLFWFLTILGWLHNTSGGVVVALALLAVTGLALWSTRQPNNQQPNHLSWRTILVTEVLFVLTFAAWCLVRAHMPRIETAGGEKWMEIAFLRAILRSDIFPPHDPWLSGFAISYYHFGYIIIAAITRLAAASPSIAFNLGVATLFALTCTGAFSLVYNLTTALPTALSAGSKKREGIGGGLLGALMVAVLGNLGGLLEMLYTRGVGPASFWQWLDVRSLNTPPEGGGWIPTRFFWWWRASRILHDYTPWGTEQEVIDEFPAFSFILGDMHPHVLGLPFVLLAIGLALNLYRRMTWRTGPDPDVWRLKLLGQTISLPLHPWEWGVYAICLGGLGFLNTWDFPIYLFVVAAAYALAHLRISPTSRLAFYGSRFLVLFLPLLVLGIVLYFPFWRSFQSQASGILPNLFNATRLPQFLVMFGPLFFIAAVYVGDRARQSGIKPGQVVKWALVIILGVTSILVIVLGLVLLLVWLGVLPTEGEIAYLQAWLHNETIAGLESVKDVRAIMTQSLVTRLANPWTAFCLLALLVAIIFVLRESVRRAAGQADDPQSTSQIGVNVQGFVLLLFATGLLLTLSVEFVYLRDHFRIRMNTVFKFYFQAWVVWAIAGAYALVNLSRRRALWAWGMVSVAALLVIAGLVYPALAIPARAREYGGPPTLDGAAYLAQVYPDDYAAIAWLNQNIEGTPVILEAPGGGYQYEGRVSAHTGLPTVLGWSGHEWQWRGTLGTQEQRKPDIDTLYSSVNLTEVLTLLDKYGISYVYVGPVERERYPAAGLAKFDSLMDVVYDTGSVTIYRR